MQRLLQVIRPLRYLSEPDNPARLAAFRLASHPYFDAGILVCILLNTLIMMLEHDRQSERYKLACATVCFCVGTHITS